MIARSSSRGSKPSIKIGWRCRQRRRWCNRENAAALTHYVRAPLILLVCASCCRLQHVASLVAGQQGPTRNPVEPDWFLSSKSTVDRRTMMLSSIVSSLSCMVLFVLPACSGLAVADAGNLEPPTNSQLTDLLRPATKDQPQIPLPSSVPDVKRVIAEGMGLAYRAIETVVAPTLFSQFFQCLLFPLMSRATISKRP
jgi:hypothetical protein